MNHEEALTALLAGGPVSADLAAHAGSCNACERELAALRRLEEAVGRARPEAPADPSREQEILDRMKRAQTGREGWARARTWLPAAASFLLAAGLAAGWLLLHSRAPAAPDAGPSANPAGAEIARTEDHGLPLWDDAGEDSTASLLQATESFTQRVQATDAEDGQELGLLDPGGWNG